jgi:hypothetical protein
MPGKDQKVVLNEMRSLLSDNINNDSTKAEINAKDKIIAIQLVTMARLEDVNMKVDALSVHLDDWFAKLLGGTGLTNIDVIRKIAQEQGVDVVWPGWGHVSDDPKLPNMLDRSTSQPCDRRQDHRENSGKAVQSKHWSDYVDVMGPSITAHAVAVQSVELSPHQNGLLGIGSINCLTIDYKCDDAGSILQLLVYYASLLFVTTISMISVVNRACRLLMVTGKGRRSIMIPFATIMKYFVVFACLISHASGAESGGLKYSPGIPLKGRPSKGKDVSKMAPD